MPIGWHQGDHDHRRLSDDCKSDRAQAGFDTEDFVTGKEVEQLTNGELAVRVRTATVFARIMPEQKLRVINALKANGRSWL